MDYFKHYSTASSANSINAMFDKFGHKGIAFWWMLVELCCENWDGQSAPDFVFHQRTVASKLKSSPNSVVPWLELCSTLGMCAFAHNGTQFEIKIPKLMEVKTSRSVIKSNKKQLAVYIEENRIDLEENRIEASPKSKVKKTPKVKAPKVSPLALLFSPTDEIQAWLLTGQESVQKELLEKFSHHVLAEEIKKAYFWQIEKKSRQAGTFLLTWMSNKKSQSYGSGMAKDGFRSKGGGVMPTDENPTGNPFIQKALDSGLIA